MFLRSIRWRLQAWYGAILVVLVTVFAAVAYLLEAARRQRETDEELQQRVSVLAASLHTPPGARREGPPPRRPEGGPPPHPPRELELTEGQRALVLGSGPKEFSFSIWLRDGRVHSQEGPGPFPPRPERAEGSPRDRDGQRQAFVYLATGDCVLVGRGTAGDAAELRRLAFTLGGSALAIVAIGLLGGWWIASRAIRPIEDISAAATRIALGDLTQRISTADQSSELGALAQVLNSTFARLESAFAQQVRFTSDAAHELRTPVSVILTQAQLTLNRERSGDEYREAIATTQRAARRMRGLIESLLELARLDAGKQELKPVACDLAGVAAEAAELIQPLLVERKVKLTVELAEAPCLADPARLGQVAANLLTNAVQHGRKDAGRITLATRSENGTSLLEVCDDGPGVAEKDRPHLFERFYRGDPSRTGVAGTKGRGGLGLSISKAIVEAHGGTIEVGAAPDGGARFTVRLPRS